MNITQPFYHNPAKEDEQDMVGTVGKVRTSSQDTFSYKLLLKDTPVLGDQQGLTLINSVWTLDTV